VKNFEDLSDWKPKKLRTLRNNLNNRLSSFKSSGDSAKDLQQSHMLHGLEEGQCKELLQKVTKLLKEAKMS
jgi:hypothetical protein